MLPPAMDISLLERFLAFLSVEKGLSRNTLQSYERDLRKYVAFLKDREPDSLVQKDVQSFLVHLSTTGMSSPTLARCLAAVRGFHKFLLTEGLARTDPTITVESPHGWKRLPKTMSSTEVETLLNQPDLSTPLGVRDKAMLELLYATGLRVS